MRLTLSLAVVLAVTGCKDKPATEPDPVVPDCADPMPALLEADMPSANAIYQACRVGSPNDPDLALGEAITSLILLYDDPSLTGLVTACGQEAPSNDTVFGPDGVVAQLEESFAGNVTITTSELVGGGDVDLFPGGPGVVQAYSSRYRSSVDVGDDVRFKNSLYATVEDERYDSVAQDYVPVSVGDSVPVTESGASLRASGPCPGGRCSWSSYNDGSSGTLTLVRTDWDGGPVELAFDAVLAERNGGPSLRLVGTLADTPFDDASIEDDLPLLDAFESSRCDTDDCHRDMEALTRLVEVCPDISQDMLHARANELNTRITALAEKLEVAGASPSATFVFPADALPVLFADVSFNQTDALMMAASMRSLAASLAMATSYDLIDPSATGASRIGDYTQGFAEFDNGASFCVDRSYWGVSSADMQAEMLAHLGELRADQQLALARTHLTHSMEDLKAGLLAAPAQDGFLDATGDRLTRDEVIADLDVVLASLGGQDGALASVPAYQITLDAFFANPLTRASITTAIGTDPLVQESGTCSDHLDAAEPLIDWFPQNNGVFPVTQDQLDANGLPGWMTSYENYDYDSDGLPRFTSETVTALEAAYGEDYYDAP